MEKQKTLCIIKPDAVSAHVIGNIIAIIEKHGFHILKMKMFSFDRITAERFYAVHRQKHFFSALVDFMTEGPVVALLLQRENAISVLRSLCGVTDSTVADPHTIRHQFGTDGRRNAVHASDSIKSAAYETQLLFDD